jgi:hypothetical protein
MSDVTHVDFNVLTINCRIFMGGTRFKNVNQENVHTANWTSESEIYWLNILTASFSSDNILV